MLGCVRGRLVTLLALRCVALRCRHAQVLLCTVVYIINAVCTAVPLSLLPRWYDSIATKIYMYGFVAFSYVEKKKKKTFDQTKLVPVKS